MLLLPLQLLAQFAVSNDFEGEIADSARETSIRDSLNCVELSNIDFSFSEDVCVLDNIAYVADAGGGLRIVDVSNLQSPILVGTYDTGSVNGFMYSLCASSFIDFDQKSVFVYVADIYEGLLMINVTDPSNPYLQYSYQIGVSPRDVFYIDSMLYMGYDDGLRIFYLDHGYPIISSHYDTGQIHGLYVKDKIAYIADYNGYLEIIDVSDGHNPKLKGSFYTGGSPWDVFVKDTIAYVIDETSGLIIINVSDIENPVRIGNSSFGFSSEGRIFVEGNYAYVGLFSYGLLVFDVIVQ